MRKIILAITLLFTMSIILAGCSKDNKDKTVKQIEDTLNTIVMNTENDSLNEEIDRELDANEKDALRAIKYMTRLSLNGENCDGVTLSELRELASGENLEELERIEENITNKYEIEAKDMQAYYLTGICLSKNLYDAVCGETEMKDYVGELIELVEKDSDPNTACDNFINENETALIIFSSYDDAFKKTNNTLIRF